MVFELLKECPVTLVGMVVCKEKFARLSWGYHEGSWHTCEHLVELWAYYSPNPCGVGCAIHLQTSSTVYTLLYSSRDSLLRCLHNPNAIIQIKWGSFTHTFLIPLWRLPTNSQTLLCKLPCTYMYTLCVYMCCSTCTCTYICTYIICQLYLLSVHAELEQQWRLGGGGGGDCRAEDGSYNVLRGAEEISRRERWSKPQPHSTRVDIMYHFLTWYCQHVTIVGISLTHRPSLAQRDLDLYKLYKLVRENGGMDKVSQELKWRSLYLQLGMPMLTNSSYMIKQAYKKWAKPWE